MVGESIEGPLNIYEPSQIYEKLFHSKWSCVLVFILLVFIHYYKDRLNYYYLTKKPQKETIFLAEITALMFLAAFSIIFVDIRSQVSVLDLFGHFLAVVGYFFIYIQTDLPNEETEALSVTHAVKQLFQYQNPKDLQEIELRLYELYQMLGLKDFYRVMFDTVLSKNKRQLWHTADPVIHMRSQFYVYFNSRQAIWGKAYPRPSVEMIEKSWKLSQGQLRRGLCGIRIEADPDLDYSTYPRALYKWEKIQKQMEEDRTRALNQNIMLIEKQRAAEVEKDDNEESYFESLRDEDD